MFIEIFINCFSNFKKSFLTELTFSRMVMMKLMMLSNHGANVSHLRHPELKNHLVAIMPDKVYGVKVLDDGDFEMSVANRYMDEVIAAVSEYQMNEPSEPSGFLGSGLSKTTVAVATASLAVGLAYYFNRKR